MSLKTLLSPRSVAVVGVSRNETKIGTVIAANIKKGGYLGKLFLVNPKHEKILGQQCYQNLAAIEEPIDVAIVAIPAPLVAEVIKGAAEKVKNFVVISAGFSETGGEGKKREEELAQLADQHHLCILGPNCLGFISPEIKLNASFAGDLPQSGKVAFVSQSGALIVALLDKSHSEGIGFSRLVSIGNKAVVDESALAEFLARDEHTEVLAFYLEDIKNGSAFIERFSKMAPRKPVVVLKAGKSSRSQQAILSHTAALAGSRDVASAVFKEIGIIEADTLEELWNLVRLLNYRVRSGQNVVIVTNAGGAGVAATDAYETRGAHLAVVSQEIKGQLRQELPLAASVENPIDLLGDADDNRYRKTLEILGKAQSIDTIHVIVTPQRQTPVGQIAREVISFGKSVPKTVFTSFIGGGSVAELQSALCRGGIVDFPFPEQAAVAVAQVAQWRHRGMRAYCLLNPNSRRAAKAAPFFTKSPEIKLLDFDSMHSVLELYGIKMTESIVVSQLEELEKRKDSIHFPCAAKVDSSKIIHKTEGGGVMLNIESYSHLCESVGKLLARFADSRIIIQKMVSSGMEIIVGATRDATFGPVITVGLGGIYTEQFRLVDHFLPAVDNKIIRQALCDSRIGFLFRKTRGKDPFQIEDVISIIASLSALLVENDCIAEVDVNPLVVYNNGDRSEIVDVKLLAKNNG